MGFVKAFNLIRFSATAHIIIGYLLIFRPQTISNDNTIRILGMAMGLVRRR